jgi:hypothetical protein
VARIVRAKNKHCTVCNAQRPTNRLLAFSRQPLAPKRIDANKLVAETCELLRRHW